MNNKLFNSIFTTTFLATVSSLLIVQPSFTQTTPEQPESIIITGRIRDFSSDHPDFERSVGDTSDDGTIFEYGLDTDIVTNTLGADGKPVYAGGSSSTTNEANFNQWFNDVEGVNQSVDYTITLTDEDGDGIYTFARDIQQGESFFPIDGMLLGNETNSHNYHFTYELDTQFTYIPGTASQPRIFTFKGDDDVHVYINDRKVIDIGGVHLQREQSVNLDTLGLVEGETYNLKLFFAERHVVHSNFRIDTNVAFVPMFAD